jgi:hypothetical protein
VVCLDGTVGRGSRADAGRGKLDCAEIEMIVIIMESIIVLSNPENYGIIIILTIYFISIPDYYSER